MDAPLDGQKRPIITRGAILLKVMTSVTRIPDLGLLVLGLILVHATLSTHLQNSAQCHVQSTWSSSLLYSFRFYDRTHGNNEHFATKTQPIGLHPPNRALVAKKTREVASGYDAGTLQYHPMVCIYAYAYAMRMRMLCVCVPVRSEGGTVRNVSLAEADEVLWVRLRVVIRHIDCGVAHVVDCRVVELVAGAHVGCERVALALAVLTDDDAHKEHVLDAVGIWA